MLPFGREILAKEGVKGFFKGVGITPWQSVTWAMMLMIFDTAGVRY